MKEMVGGCCVCSDERGWPENPLVYCDGQNCTVAVHQACYGIVTVPTGPWYCRKCESQERTSRVRCAICPSRDGALKKTDTSGWAHVVCALYIPEIRFGNVTTMEPIILTLIPQERYSKSEYNEYEKNFSRSLIAITFFSLLHLPGDRETESCQCRCLYAVQQGQLQAAISCDLRPESGTTLRGGWQLSGQRKVLRILPASL